MDWVCSGRGGDPSPLDPLPPSPPPRSSKSLPPPPPTGIDKQEAQGQSTDAPPCTSSADPPFHRSKLGQSLLQCPSADETHLSKGATEPCHFCPARDCAMCYSLVNNPYGISTVLSAMFLCYCALAALQLCPVPSAAPPSSGLLHKMKRQPGPKGRGKSRQETEGRFTRK